MMYYEKGGPTLSLSDDDLRNGLYEALGKGPRPDRVLALPPDITRLHSKAGFLTVAARDYYGKSLTDIMPALGTHYPMTPEEKNLMFPGVDHGLFRDHRWRTDLTTLGRVPGEFIGEMSEGKLDFDWPAQVNSLLAGGRHDLILSPGQVVPHEVIGFANHNKNIFIGTGGAEAIHKSHFLGAVYGMERIMGRTDTPVRRVLNYASEHFGGQLPPILYILTVVSPDDQGRLHTRGLFIGDGYECYEKAAALSERVNLTPVDKPLSRCVVYLDPREFRSTWLGNKAVYRTRMAMADGGELIILAPGLKEFGEDPAIDALIRRYGYRGTEATLESVRNHRELADNLSAAAHLIHGSSEGRFSITYAPGHLSREEVEGAGYLYAGLSAMEDRFRIEGRQTGYGVDRDGEEFYFIRNPALGLWNRRDPAI